ncbi:DUF2189 domain-containing protein [Marinovum algicola]|uniref:DUF2189 domain-containing protein n=1 Tax=Marinovum algicola TaxID=42444 RepID=UPI0024BB0081|nr:DUF2189 domain-containing protein [Marinovum algicola]
MTETIGNPLSWSAQALGKGLTSTGEIVEELHPHETSPIVIRDIDIGDLRIALSKGYEDFLAMRTDVMWIVLVYPVMGFVLAWFAATESLLPLLFPLVSGFALLGPVAGVGLYEMSRRREAGMTPRWRDGFGVAFSPAAAPMVVLGGYLMALFVAWMMTALVLYNATLGPAAPTSASAFVTDVFTTTAGLQMLGFGLALGFVFAALVLITALISFPMLVDRRVGLPLAVATSVEVAWRNPITVAVWGMIVAALLTLGFVTLFVGLIFVLPILGHATWHLYRRAVAPPEPAAKAPVSED